MRRIAIINQKGGVGKTTTTANLAAALARAGRRVLVFDLDPQSHLSLHLGLDPAAGKPGMYELLTGDASIAKVRTKVANNLWVVGASIDLAAAEVELVSVVGREVILRDLLEQHMGKDKAGIGLGYDFVLIDCPPSLGVLTLNGLSAAGEVIIPLQAHYLALQGLGKLLETVLLVGKRINPGLTVAGVLLCMFDAGTKLANEVVEDVRSFLEGSRGTDVPWSKARLFETVIRRNIKLAEAPSFGQSIFGYAADSNGAKDYEQLARELDGVAQPASVESGKVHPKAQKVEPISIPSSAAPSIDAGVVAGANAEPTETAASAASTNSPQIPLSTPANTSDAASLTAPVDDAGATPPAKPARPRSAPKRRVRSAEALAPASDLPAEHRVESVA